MVELLIGDAGHEGGIVSAIKKLAPSKPVIWGVGANAGFFVAELARKVGGYTEIRMFEPNPKLMPILRQLAGCLPRLYAHNLALSNVVTSAVLHIPNGHSDVASLMAKPNSISLSVECTTGDSFLERTGAADTDVVIIDTEGNDARVILGLREIIRRKRPAIFFEHLFLSDDDVRSTMPENYRHFTVDDGSGELIDGLDRRRGHNSVYVPQP